jgi:replicative DNA helicase
MQRYDQVADISRSLKGLARELNIPVVVLCQLNREAQWEVPNLSNLRDSGSIEQDADLVLFLHKETNRKNKKNQDETPKPEHEDKIPTDLIIAKQRNGPVGLVKLSLHSKYTRFFPVFQEHKPGVNPVS